MSSDETPVSASILVVDDSEVNRLLLRRRLEAAGHRVTVANDGREALAKIEAEPFDLVLLDVMMPEVGGLEVLETVRRTRTVAELPIIMATANDEVADIVKAFSLGANDYVTKPFDFAVVLARTGTQLALRRAMDENRRLVEEVELRNRFIRQTFGRYVDREVVERLLATHEGLSIGGEKRRVTVLMSDLRGFTSMAERLAPESVVAIINNYLTVMTDVIMECGGTIDEFIGDAILVLFGAPVERPDHARAAVVCALKMQLAIAEVNRRNREQSLPDVEMGIGIDSGEVVVGNIGSEKRTKYGVVGRTVNLASRIESYTLGGQTIVSETTAREAGNDLVIGSSIEVHPKGSPQPITLHRIRGIGDIVLPETDDAVVTLGSPVAVRYAVVEGKDAGGVMRDAELVGISLREAVLRADEAPAALSNVKMQFATGDEESLYAKVTDDSRDDQFRIRFTSVPDGAAQSIRALLRLG